MTKVICVLGKSGTGKSTLINKLVDKYPNIFYGVKSYSTRIPRDEFDKQTHVFVKPKFYKENQDKVLLDYYNPDQEYHNWVDSSSFKQDKINLYAIDVLAYNYFNSDSFKDKTKDVYGIYLYVDEIERGRRMQKRGDTEFTSEDYLDKSKLGNSRHPCLVVDVSKCDEIETSEFIEQYILNILKLVPRGE